jgi:histidine triad (HIT) family protein
VEGCLFCRIIAGELPGERLFEDADVLAFTDVSPKAPTHVLIVPKAHHTSLDDVPTDQAPLLGRLLLTARDLAARLGLSGGYRLIVNTGRDGGQTVGHLHLHLLGGRPMSWPPG